MFLLGSEKPTTMNLYSSLKSKFQIVEAFGREELHPYKEAQCFSQ